MILPHSQILNNTSKKDIFINNKILTFHKERKE